MLALCDDDFDQIELAEGALILNQAVEPLTQVQWAQQELDRLLQEAELTLFHEVDEWSRFDALLRLFYCEWAFHGDRNSYFASENAFLDQVLKRRQGIPVSLGALLLYLGRKLGFALDAVVFPTQFLVKVSVATEVRYVNPFNGEYVSQHILHAWLIGHQGPLAQLNAEKHLQVADNSSVIGLWLAVLKSALIREGNYTQALRCTDLALSWLPDDPYEIRDRGFIYLQLDCHQVALMDYQYFIEQCPDDPSAGLLQHQVDAMRNTVATIH